MQLCKPAPPQRHWYLIKLLLRGHDFWFRTRRKSAVAVESIENYEALIQDAKEDLVARLESIDQKLEQLAEKDGTLSDPDAAELYSLKEERRSTEKCLQICAQLSDHIDQIQLLSDDTSPAGGSEMADSSPETVTNKGLQECKRSLIATTAKLEKHMQEVMDQILAKSKRRVSSDEDTQVLSRLRDEWEAARQCLDICSHADSNFKESVSVIENYGTGDALQFMVSANGKVLHGKNRGMGWRSRQVGGYMSNGTIQQLSRDLTVAHPISLRADNKPFSKTSLMPDASDVADYQTTPEFSERYGRGFTLSPTLKPETNTTFRSMSREWIKSEAAKI